MCGHIRQSIGTYTTVAAKFWPWLSGKSPQVDQAKEDVVEAKKAEQAAVEARDKVTAYTTVTCTTVTYTTVTYATVTYTTVTYTTVTYTAVE